MRNHQQYAELLSLEVDGELTPPERRLLADHLRSCDDCRRERDALAELAGLLTASRIPVADGFRAELMERLPAAGWQSRHPMSWAAAVAVLVVLAGGAAALAGSAAAASAPVAAAVVAVLELFGSSLVAGAGLLNASWRGIGLALGRLFDGSLLNLVALGVVVLGLDLLFLRLLLRTRRAVAAGDRRRTDDGG